MIAAPPMPCTARAAISISGVVATAHAADAAANSAMPAVKTRLRPKRSPRATAIRMKLAKDSEYALMNHWRSSMDAPSDSCMTGSALVTTRLSRVAMNAGSEAAAMIKPTGLRVVVMLFSPYSLVIM